MGGQQVYIVPEDELSRRFREMEDRIVERLRPQMQVVEKTVSHKQAAAFLNIHPDTLTDRLRAGTYPASIVHMNGSKREYYLSELKEFLNQKRR